MALQISLSILTIICLIAAFYTPNVQAIVAKEPVVEDVAFELELGEQPWLSLLELPHGVFCSGTIVSPTAVLSAALCLSGVTEPTHGMAYAGNVKYRRPADLDPLSQNRSIVEYHLYDENNTLIYNFMLVKIDPKWTWSGNVQPIGIIEEEKLPNNFNSLCYVSGLGDGAASEDSQVARAAVVRMDACARSPQNHRLCYNDSGAFVASAGDLGGPMLCDREPRNKLYGIISEHGRSGLKEHQEFYVIPARANGFEFVGFYAPWIKKTAGDLLTDEEVEAIRQEHKYDFLQPLGVNGLFSVLGRHKVRTPSEETGAGKPEGGASEAGGRQKRARDPENNQQGQEQPAGGAQPAGEAGGEEESESESGAEWRRGAALAALLSAGAVRALC